MNKRPGAVTVATIPSARPRSNRSWSSHHRNCHPSPFRPSDPRQVWSRTPSSSLTYIVEKEPADDDVAAWRHRAHVMGGEGRNDEELAAWERVLSLVPGDEQAISELKTIREDLALVFDDWP